MYAGILQHFSRHPSRRSLTDKRRTKTARNTQQTPDSTRFGIFKIWRPVPSIHQTKTQSAICKLVWASFCRSLIYNRRRFRSSAGFGWHFVCGLAEIDHEFWNFCASVDYGFENELVQNRRLNHKFQAVIVLLSCSWIFGAHTRDVQGVFSPCFCHCFCASFAK